MTCAHWGDHTTDAGIAEPRLVPHPGLARGPRAVRGKGGRSRHARRQHQGPRPNTGDRLPVSAVGQSLRDRGQRGPGAMGRRPWHFLHTRGEVALPRHEHGDLAGRLHPEAERTEDVRLVADWCAWLLLRDDRWDSTEDPRDWERLADRDLAYLRLMRRIPGGRNEGDGLASALADLCVRTRARPGERLGRSHRWLVRLHNEGLLLGQRPAGLPSEA